MFEELKPHLFELRKRLIFSVLSVAVCFFIVFFFHNMVLEWMTEPLNKALIEVGKISIKAQNGMITTNQVGGAFFVALKEFDIGI